MQDTKKIRIGVSSCLLGNPVRYDGGHKKNVWLVNTLGKYVEFVPVCPEVEMGLSVPREPLRLVGDPENPRLVTIKTYQDYTQQMKEFSEKRVRELEKEDLCGFVFKRASPSSGMERVKVYKDVDPNVVKNPGAPSLKGVGAFARVFMEHFPLLPVEEEGRLGDAKLRENFIERIFALQRWREFLETSFTLRGLIEFHTRHKLLLMSHSVVHYRAMGKLVAAAKQYDATDLIAQYQKEFLTALALHATVKKHTNVLHHIVGYFKKQLSADEKQEILEIIEQYHNQLVPLIVPVTLLNHFVRKYGEEYLREQWYLNPHPAELKLRNHV